MLHKTMSQHTVAQMQLQRRNRRDCKDCVEAW